MSVDSLAAAKELMAAGRWRSCVSRAYYAFYARVTAELQGLAEFPEGRDGPSHEDLPDMLYDYLTRLSHRDRWQYSTVVSHMYLRRVAADYQPALTVDQQVAREAVTWTEAFIKAMEVAYG